MLTIKIKVRNIESARQIIESHKFINHDYRIKVEDGFGYIPIKDDIAQEELDSVINEVKDAHGEDFTIELVDNDSEFDSIKIYPRSMMDLLKDKLSEDEIADLNSAYDVIGDVVIVEIPEELQIHKKEIGEALLAFTKRRTIYMKKSKVKGVTRVGDLELLAGEDNPITIHKEHGTRLKLDVKNVYFSPRLATERKRVADLVRDGEEILDMFAGVGPFPFVIAKEKSVDITAIDINEVAIQYLNENIKINKVKDGCTIRAICGDTNIVAQNELKGRKFDRLIMNLPGLAPEFLDLAVSLAKDGGVIHYYEFSNGFSQGIEEAQIACEKQNKDVEILNTRKVKSTSPGMWHVVIDCKIKDKN